jgi:hypothetical protein
MRRRTGFSAPRRALPTSQGHFRRHGTALAEGAIAEPARLPAARPAEATAPTRPLVSRAEAATEDDRADRRSPLADEAAAVRPVVRITIGRIDIQVTGAETPSPGRARSALSDAARLRRAGVRRL